MEPYAAALDRFAADHNAPGVELVYASHPSWPLPETRGNHGDHLSLSISILDSSFNPPTNAHLALTCLPASEEISSSLRAFDAKLLLFSIKNADKTLKSGDATPSQRLQMMVLMARELQEQSEDRGSQNIAVAVCQMPTFVQKNAAIRLFLHERMIALSPLLPHIQLAFLLGFDTFERLFAPKFYGSESAMKDALRQFFSASGDGSRIICARRSSGASYSQVDTGVLDTAAEYIQSGAVTMVDIGEEERKISSSEVREMIQNASESWEHRVPRLVAAYIKRHNLYAQREELY